MSDCEKEELVIRGSGDFLADQRIEDPAEFRVKCHLCHEIATIVEKRGLAPHDVAVLAGETEQEIERILRSPHDDCEVWRLIKVLCALGADVGIFVNRDSGHETGVVLAQTIKSGGDLP
jgi:predicted XRE-type DNA-binding protein